MPRERKEPDTPAVADPAGRPGEDPGAQPAVTHKPKWRGTGLRLPRRFKKAKPGSPPSFSAYLRKTLGPSNWMALQQLDEMSAEVLCNIICPEILKVIGRDEG